MAGLVGGALGMTVYLNAASHLAGFGFPLDDAWIHMTYARNLAHLGQWAFIPGEISGGSTSPLWTVALSAGFALGITPLIWVIALGVICLAAAGLLSACWIASRRPDLPSSALILIAGAIALEWHLVWAGLSGMETLLFALAILGVMLLSEDGKAPTWTIGCLIGLAVWIRPDALSLLLPAAWVEIARWKFTRQTALRLATIGAGFAVAFGPYLVFNRLTDGAWWPATFYAKQAEYASLRQLPLWLRLGELSIQPLVGAGLLLLPGLGLDVFLEMRSRRYAHLAPALWIAAFIGMYAFRLPVTYQHGRYLMPVIPVLWVVGLDGMLHAIRLIHRDGLRWILTRFWTLSLAGTCLAFVWLGARSYARDVAIIQTEMVDIAKWVAQHTEPDALIAAHDIGALGYFGDRRLLDLAGLVSPEVIPIIRNQPALADYITRRGASYLVTFPGWYPELVSWARPVHRSGGIYSPAAGGENMTVYRWLPARFAWPFLSVLYSPQSGSPGKGYGTHRIDYR
jgi:arabinofuranosyltransferase